MSLTMINCSHMINHILIDVSQQQVPEARELTAITPRQLKITFDYRTHSKDEHMALERNLIYGLII